MKDSIRLSSFIKDCGLIVLRLKEKGQAIKAPTAAPWPGDSNATQRPA